MADLNVGIVGLGNRGVAMAKKLAGAGLAIQVYDFHAQSIQLYTMEGGRDAAPTAGFLAQWCDVAFLTHTAPEATRQAIRGAPDFVGSLNEQHIVVDMSHSSPLEAGEFARALAPRGVGYVDAPVVRRVSDEAQEMVLVGGTERSVERVWPALQALGLPLVRTGRSGTAQAARAVLGAATALIVLGTGEALLAAKRFGLEPSAALEALGASTGASGAAANTLAALAGGSAAESGYTFSELRTDLAHFLQMSRDAGAPALLAAMASEIGAQAALNLEAPRDYGDIVRWLERIAGTQLGGTDRASS